ncbi:MAG: PEP-CTERM sorting domain-containing protein [Planctomycetota bacterium]
MHQNLLLSLTACFCFAACADHSGTAMTPDNGPQAPVNPPDSGAWNAPERNGASSSTSSSTAPVSGAPGSGGEGSSAGSTAGPGIGSSGGSNSGSGGTGLPPEEGGQPVPEPGTLLLVGSGLAGVALLRRRRQQAR